MRIDAQTSHALMLQQQHYETVLTSGGRASVSSFDGPSTDLVPAKNDQGASNLSLINAQIEGQKSAEQSNARQVQVRQMPEDIIDIPGVGAILDENPKHGLKDLDIHTMTPREMSDFSMDLYVNGLIGWDEYSMMADQPELHPDFDATIGALTGQKAEPDRARDYLGVWQDKLDFEKRYPSSTPQQGQRLERIVAVLQSLNQSIDFAA